MTAPDLTAFIEACRAPMLHNVFVSSQDLDTEEQFLTSAYSVYKTPEGTIVPLGISWEDGPEFGFFQVFEIGIDTVRYDSHGAIVRVIREFEDESFDAFVEAVNAMMRVYDAADALLPEDGLSAAERKQLLELINDAADPLDQAIEIEEDDEDEVDDEDDE
jgi:hypothetical protein